ncbi:hypothetical protein GH714_022832 [Hevea brasiliensis]|uniref:Uncharacterized protein n=1 Tax=Hevea brasiliensis TaxID=3981 RepID=A0A6A6KLN4_HEVBR|nr:hypothetical protein GH714_022832 [Hevea brasiliensis]
MNTRYFSPLDSLCNSGTTVSFSANSAVGEDRGPVITRSRSSRTPPSTFLIRMAMRISRARWFTFLRRPAAIYGRYRQVNATQGDGFGLSDLEQQRGSDDSRPLAE